MATDTFDPFAGDTGLKDDFDGTISHGEFTQDERGNYRLDMTITTDDGEEVSLRLGLGKGWASYDGGETVEGASPRARFNERTGYQRFIKKAMASGGEEQIRAKNSEPAYQGRGPMHADFWTGMRFHFDVVEEDGARQVEGKWEDVKTPAIRPTRWLGSGQGSGQTSPAPVSPSSAPAGPAAAPPNPALSAPSAKPSDAPSTATQAVGISEADLATITAQAKEAASYDDFADRVMALTSSDGTPMVRNRNVMVQLSDENWYLSLKS